MLQYNFILLFIFICKSLCGGVWMSIVFASNRPDTLDFWVDSKSIMFEAASYGTATQYYYINAGFRTFTAYPTRTTQNPVIQFYAVLEDDGGLFTLVIYGNLQVLLLRDDDMTTKPVVRFMNLCSGTTKADMAINSANLFTGIQYLNYTTWTPLRTLGSVTINVAVDSNRRFDRQLVVFEQNKGYSVYLVGDTSAPMIVYSTTYPNYRSNSYIRLSQFSPDAPVTDLWIDGSLVLPSQNYRSISNWKNISEGVHNISFFSHTSGAPFYSFEAFFKSNRAFTIWALNPVSSIYHMMYSDNVLSPSFPPSDQANLKAAQFYLANDPQYKLLVDDQVLWSSLRPLNITSYANIVPGRHTFTLQPQASSEELFSLRNINIDGGTLNTISILPYSTGVELFLVNENLPINLPPITTLSPGISSSSSTGTIAFNSSSSSSSSTTGATNQCIRVKRPKTTTGKARVSSPGTRIPPSKWILAIMVWIAFVL